MDFEQWLKMLAAEGGSDLYLTTGALPSAKFSGEMRALSDTPLSAGQTRTLAYDLMDEQQAREFDEKLEMNLAISLAGVGRFRINIFKQRNEVGMVVRYIVVDIPAMEQLGLPSTAADLIKAKPGLGVGSWSNRFRQIDNVGLADRPSQQFDGWSYCDH